MKRTRAEPSRRKTARTHITETRCKLTVLGPQDRVLETVMQNIGAGGTLVSAAASVPIEREVMCEFQVPPGAKHVLHGVVRRCSPRAESKGGVEGGTAFDIAVEFNPNQPSEAELTRWVFTWIGLQGRAHTDRRANPREP